MPRRTVRLSLYFALFSVLLSQFPAAAATRAALAHAVPDSAVRAPQTTAPVSSSIVALPPSVPTAPAPHPAPAAPMSVRAPGVGPFPLAFVGNAGQSDAAVRFLVRSRGGTFFFGATEAVLAVPIADPSALVDDRGRRHGPRQRVAGSSVVRLRYDGANPQRALRPGQRLLGVVNELTGNDPRAWLTNLPTYDSLSYTQLYPGIDLRYDGVDGQLKRTYLVAAGADPGSIRWRYQGATDVRLDAANGDLVIALAAPATGLPGASLRERAPIAWQDSGGRRVPVAVQYVVGADGSMGFALGAYDPAQPLTIDPVLTYSTFLGGSGNDEGSAITVDAAGNTYVAGGTFSSNFPTAGALQGSRAGSEDVFISKVSADGTTLLYSTYLGGSKEDEANAIALDAAGNIVLAGETQSSNYPTQNALDSTFGGSICTGGDPCEDAFVTKLNAAGSALLYSTYLGGGDDDQGNAIAVGSAGAVFVTGETASRDTTPFPTQNARQSTKGGGSSSDIFFTKLDTTASGSASLLYSSYLGGSSYDKGLGIALDSATGYAYLTGYSQSTNFPTVTPLQASRAGDKDAIVAVFNPAVAGSGSLLYSTYLGGTLEDRGFGIARDSAGMLYLTGLTRSSNFPTASPIQSSIGGGTCGTITCTDVFVTQFDLAHNTLGWSTYLGGNNDDEGDAIAVDSSGAVYITGITASSNFPTTAGARQGTYGGGSRDAFVAKIGASTAATTATLTLAPASAGPDVRGTQQPMQATLINQHGAPIAGTSVHFTVSGPNATSGTATTTASGTASFTYTGTLTGTDSVQASATVGGIPLTSNVAHVGWITPLKDIATTTVWARFFTNPNNASVFDRLPTTTPVFTQTFPTLNFNPISGSVPGAPAGLDQGTRPFTNVTTDKNGTYTGSIVAQGNGAVAGQGTLAGFEAVFSGAFVVKTASTLTLSVYGDNGFTWGVGPDAQGHQPTGSGGGVGSTPFFHFPALTNNGVLGFATSSITFPAAGVYPYEIDFAEDGESALSLSVLTAANTQGLPPSGAVTLSPSSTTSQATGQTQLFTAVATDAAGAALPNQPLVLTVTGANPRQIAATTSITGLATFSYSGANVGTDTAQAITWISGIAVYSGQVTKTWTPGTAPGSSDPLAVPGQIGSPRNGAVISDTVPIVLAAGLPAQTCTVDYWPATNPSAVTTLATNVAGSGGATLANLDTSTLGNGAYVIRVRCTDGSGTQVQSGVLVTVVGENKPGRVRFDVTDLTVPVTGLPITIGRTYDSLERGRSGDFGFGWSLSIGSPRLEVNAAHDVTVTQPNGQRVTFFFTPQSMGGVFGFFLAPTYTPEAGAYGRLTANGCDLLVGAGNGYVCFLDGAYQPTTYTYTDPYGRVFVMGADGSLQSITDLNQNKLTFGPSGISSSAGGRSVAFVRDGQGRITQVIDPANKSYTYVYSATGDLGSVALPGVATPIRYGYDASHLVKAIVDPRGHAVATATYYADGRLKDETDAVGNTTSYGYNLLTNTNSITYPDQGVRRAVVDGYGKTLSETDPLTHTTTSTYDSNHNLSTRTDALGHTTSYTYDGNGHQTSVTGPLAATSRTAYNQYGGPTTITDTIGVTQTVLYDASFMPSSIVDRLGTHRSFSFDSHGSLLTEADGTGKTTTYTYDAYGNQQSITDPLGHTTSFTYDTLGRQLTSTDPLGKLTRYQYDALGHTLAITDALGFVTTYTYDGSGNKRTETDARNHTTTSTYDNANRLTNTRFADTSAITTTDDFRGNKLTETDQLGSVTTYVYDKAGQLTSVTAAFGTADAATMSYSYSAIGERTSTTDPLSHATTTTYVYDTLHHTKVLTETAPTPLSYLTTTFLNAAGQRTRVIDASNRQTSYQYDARGALTRTTYPDSSTSQQSYDGAGHMLSRTDQGGKITRYTYDDDGQLHTVTNPLTQTTTYAYDTRGNLASIADANSHTSTLGYDALSRPVTETLPLAMAAISAYDAVGNLTSHTDFNTKTTTYTYDTLNRLTLTTPDASLAGQTPIGLTYFPTGVRKTMTDAGGTTTFGYDARNRLLSKAAPQGTLSYTYDAASNLRSMRSNHTNGITVTYTYDALNRLSTVVDNRLGAGANATTYVYSPTSTLKTVTLPNGVVTNYGYNSLDRLTSLVTKKTTTTLASYIYTLRLEGNRSQVVEAGGRTVAYTYDNAYRLLSETISGGSVNGALGYTYDAVGNRTSRTSTVAGIVAVPSYTYDANDRLNGTTYDNNGNTTVAGGVTYGYDFRDKLTSATGGISIIYDGDGNRVAQTAGGTTTQYLVDDLNPTGYPQVVEELVGGAVQRTYTYGHALISQTQVSGSPTTSFYGDDGLGSVRHLSNTAGTKTNTYDYDAFGNVITSSTLTPNSYLFTGEQFDTNLGLYYLRARYYNQGGGRFWSRDTYPLDMASPQELDRYVYTNVDPSGLTLAVQWGMQFNLQTLKAIPAAIALGLAVACVLNLTAQQLGAPLQGPCTIYSGVIQIQGQDIRGNQDGTVEDTVRGGAWMLSSPWFQNTPLTAKEARSRLGTLIFMLDQDQRTRRSQAYRSAVEFTFRCAAGGGCQTGGSWQNNNLPRRFNEARIDIVISRGTNLTP